MAKSKKSGTKSNRRASFRNEKGQFVSNNYHGKIYKHVNGEKIFVGFSVPQQRHSRGKNQFVERVKTINEGKPFSAGGNRTVFVKDLPNWQDIQKTQKPAKIKSTDTHFEYSYIVQKRWGIDKEQQKAIWEILRQANQIGAEYRELTDGVYDAHFSYNLESAETFTRLEKRIQAAQRVISGEYFEEIATKYKQDFKESFSNMLDKSTMIVKVDSGYMEISEKQYFNALKKEYPNLSKKEIEILMEEGTEVDLLDKKGKFIGRIKNITDVVFQDIEELSDEEFFQLLRKTGNSSLAYALDSIVDSFGYNKIIKELLYVGNLARELR